jgi:hypothetical protein
VGDKSKKEESGKVWGRSGRMEIEVMGEKVDGGVSGDVREEKRGLK